jgi:hypothetical protein
VYANVTDRSAPHRVDAGEIPGPAGAVQAGLFLHTRGGVVHDIVYG